MFINSNSTLFSNRLFKFYQNICLLWYMWEKMVEYTYLVQVLWNLKMNIFCCDDVLQSMNFKDNTFEVLKFAKKIPMFFGSNVSINVMFLLKRNKHLPSNNIFVKNIFPNLHLNIFQHLKRCMKATKIFYFYNEYKYYFQVLKAWVLMKST
jgi:hypothetical protein